MLTFLGLLGRLASPLLAFMPGINPKAIMALAGLLAGLVVIGGPAGAVWLHMYGVKREAVRLADAACELGKAEDARIAAETMTHLLDRISKTETGGDDGKTAKQLCQDSPFCRDGKNKK